MSEFQDMRHFLKESMEVTPCFLPLLFFLGGILPVLFGLGFCGYVAGLAVPAVFLFIRSRFFLSAFVKFSGLFLFGALLCLLHLDAPWDTYQTLLGREECSVMARIRINDVPPPVTSDGTLRLTVSFQSIFKDKRWYPCRGTALALLPADTQWRYGDIIELDGIALVPDGTVEQSSYRRHLLSLGIRHILTPFSCRRLSHAIGLRRYFRSFFELRNSLSPLLTCGMSPHNANLYQTMLLGRKDLFPSEAREAFIRSATIHVFAISGLHVSILALVLCLLLQALGFGIRFRSTCAAALIVVYVCLTGMTPSAIRACMLVVLSVPVLFLRRCGNPMNSLLISAFCLLLFNPLLLYHSGFIFSFTSVCTLLASKRFTDSMQALLMEKYLWRPQFLRHYHLESLLHKLIGNSCALVVAWLVSTPITMVINGLLPIGTLMVNYAAQLIALLLVIFAVPKILLGLVFLRASCWLGNVIDWLVSLLTMLAETGGEGSLCLSRPAPSGLYACLLVIMVLILLVAWDFRKPRRAACAFTIVWLLLAFLPDNTPPQSIVITCGTDETFPAVAFLDAARNHVHILSGGSYEAATTMARFLTAKGTAVIDSMPSCPPSQSAPYRKAFTILQPMQPPDSHVCRTLPAVPVVSILPEGPAVVLAAGHFRLLYPSNRKRTIILPL